jgi:hypothetical protein
MEDAMKKIALLLFLTMASYCWAGPKPDPSQYTVKIHVSSSLVVFYGTQIRQYAEQQIQATIDGKKYALHGGTGVEKVLKTGDYKARVVKDEPGNGIEYMRSYEILFPDGTLRRYDVIGEQE